MTRSFSPAIMRLAQDLGRSPEEIDHEVFMVIARTWERKRLVATEAMAIEGVSLAAELAEVKVQRAVDEWYAKGAVIPEIPARRWGLRRAFDGVLE